MNYLSAIGKTLDQPLLISKFSGAVPGILISGAAAYTVHDTYKAKDGEKKKTFIKNICVLGATVASALVATRGLKLFGKQIFNGLSDVPGVKAVKGTQTSLIEGFMKKASCLSEEITAVLDKAKKKILKPSEVKLLHEQLGKTDTGKNFLKNLIPDPENVTSREILGEIGKLSMMGLMPVVGGIGGGVAGDMLTEKNWKEKFPNKIKEGFYQYLANIFLCNVGAGTALGVMEKMNVKSKTTRALGMVGGIMATGVIGGSAIANYIGKKIVNPIFDRGKGKGNNLSRLYSERKPELLDVGLHIDDVATVAVLSGLRWIEPSLPMLYSVSGYRAGIGYRNGDCPGFKKNFRKKYKKFLNQL